MKIESIPQFLAMTLILVGDALTQLIAKMRKGEVTVSESVYSRNKKAQLAFDEFCRNNAIPLDKVVVESAERTSEGRTFVKSTFPDLSTDIDDIDEAVAKINSRLSAGSHNMRIQIAYKREDTSKSANVILK